MKGKFGRPALFILVVVAILAIVATQALPAMADGPNRTRRGTSPTPTPTPLRSESVKPAATATPTPTPTATPTPLATAITAPPAPSPELGVISGTAKVTANVAYKVKMGDTPAGPGTAVFLIPGSSDFKVYVFGKNIPLSSGVQVKIKHAKNIILDDVGCLGLFKGADAVVNSEDQPDGTLVGCYFVPETKTSGSGEILSFRLKMVLDLSLGGSGPLGTEFSLGGIPADPGNTSSYINATVSLAKQ